MDESVKARFLCKTIPEPNSGCHLWLGYTTPFGHGLFRFDGQMRPAHRIAWIIANGPIPRGEGYHGTCVCHRCDNPCCVNPDHLFLATQRENSEDRDAKGRLRSSNAMKTHCKHGHPFTRKNTYWTNLRRRKCRACHVVESRRSRLLRAHRAAM